MGLLAAAFRPETRALNESEWLLRAMGGPTTYTGRQVGVTDALRLSAVYACVEVITDTVATCPCDVRRVLPNGGNEIANDHRLYGLLHDAPNPEMTAAEFWSAASGHRELWGNHFSEIEYDNAARVVGLWPLRPDRMEVKRDEKTRVIRYTYTIGGERIPMDPSRVFHWRGLSNDGIVGYSRIALAREAIGLGLAYEEYASRFFGNDASPGGVLQHPGKLSKEGSARLKASWEDAHRGLTKAHRVAVLEEGVSWQAIGVPQKDAQFIEQRKYQLEEIARIMRVPPHKVGILERSTNNNIEHQGIEFARDTMAPRFVSAEQRIDLSLLSDDHRGRFFAKFNTSQLLVGDSLSQAQVLQIERQNGVINADDWLARTGRNPLPNGLGKIYIVPINFQTVDKAAEPTPDPTPDPNAADAPSGDS